MTDHRLRIRHYIRGGCTIVVPDGVLDVMSYPHLRDTLLKHAAQSPCAVIVDLHGLHIGDGDDATVLGVFPAAAMMVSAWPQVQLLLAAPRGRVAELLAGSAVTRYTPCHPDVAAAVVAVSTQPPLRRRHLDLPAVSSAPRQAREWIRQVFHSWGIDDRPTVDAAVLIGSELVENTVAHARTPGRLRLEQRPHGLAIAMSDDDPTPPTRPLLPRTTGADPGDAAHGLSLIDALALTWGHNPRHPTGKTVWAVLAHPRPANDPDPPVDHPPPESLAPTVRVPSEALRTGFALTDLTLGELWLRYIALTGSMSPTELTAALHGSDLPAREYDLIALALNEYTAEHTSSFSVSYADETGRDA